MVRDYATELGRMVTTGKLRAVELKALVGRHVLDGVDRVTLPIDKGWGGGTPDVISFRLDGVTYHALEDPSDGYRSSMESLYTSMVSPLTTFPATTVFGIAEGQDARVVAFYTELGARVLRVGTDDADDYYPSFVAEFDPTVLPCNLPAAQAASVATDAVEIADDLRAARDGA